MLEMESFDGAHAPRGLARKHSGPCKAARPLATLTRACCCGRSVYVVKGLVRAGMRRWKPISSAGVLMEQSREPIYDARARPLFTGTDPTTYLSPTSQLLFTDSFI